MALKHVYYCMWSGLSVQVWCMRQGAWGWCTGMTLRDGMGREVGGGSGWGTHVHQWWIHVSVWQKPPQYCKVIRLQFKKKCHLEKRKNSEQSGLLNLLPFKDQIGWWSGYMDGHLVSFPFYRALYHMMFYIDNQKKISRLFKTWKWKKYPCYLFNAHAIVN